MRSLIILEVEHGETTDDLQSVAECIGRYLPYDTEGNVSLNNYTVRVDLPACFVLDSGNTDNKE